MLNLLASGLSDREIAKRLVVSNETAHTYTKRLLQTLNVQPAAGVAEGNVLRHGADLNGSRVHD